MGYRWDAGSLGRVPAPWESPDGAMAKQQAVEHLILGDGAAGMAAAQALRSLAPGASILVVSDDPRPYYYRAALTNYVAGRLDEERLDALAPERRDALDLRREKDLLEKLLPREHVAHFARLGPVRYGTLLIATGASARRLRAPAAGAAPGAPGTVPGADLDGLTVLRTLADANDLIERAEKARHAVVLGGGILGLEAAQALHETQSGIAVTVVHRGPALLERVLDRTASDLVLQRVRADGVNVVLAGEVTGFAGKGGHVREVLLAGGQKLAADLVLMALGNVPNTAPWIEGTGIATQAGCVKVDRQMRVEGVEDVWAAGDVASFEDPNLPFTNPGGLWQPAVKQGIVAGRNMARAPGAKPVEYRPGAVLNATRAWDLDVASLGRHVDEEGDTVRFERRHADPPVYKRALLRDGRVVGALLVGDRREATALQELMNLRGAAGDVRTIADDLFSPEFDLFSWVDAQRRAPGVGRHDRAVDLPVGARPHGVTRSAAPLTQRSLGQATGARTAAFTSLPPPPLHLTLDGRPVAAQGERLTVGGTGALGPEHGRRGAAVRLDDPGVREASFTIERQGMVWMALPSERAPVDLLRNGRRLARRAPLKHGDTLDFGAHRLVVALGDRPMEAPPPPPTPEAAFLLGARRRYDLVPPAVRVGRDAGCAVGVEHASVAPHHADLTYDAAARAWTASAAAPGLRVEVNGEPVVGARRLADRDRLTLGRVTLTFARPSSIAPAAGVGAQAVTGAVRGHGYLLAARGPLAGEEIALAPGAVLGRGAGASIRLDDPRLSEAHLRFEARSAGRLAVVDLGSRNGTAVNGERLAPDAPRDLAPGDRLAVGRHEFRFSPTSAGGRSFDQAGQAREHVEGRTVEVARSAWRLEQAQEGGPPAAFPLLEDLVRVGRAPHNDLHLPHGDVSREHATLVAVDRGYELRDLTSTAGTTLNGRRVPPESPVRLEDGDEVAFAKHAFRVKKVPRAPTDEVGASPLRLRAALVPLMPRLGLDRLALPGSGPWIVGRQASASAVVVPLDTVSRTHCEIRRAGERFHVRNLSSNGTSLNGRAVPDDAPVELQDGDVLALQDVPFRFQLQREGAGAAPPPPSERFQGGAGLASRNPLEADLEAVVERELAACIGCHECLTACPLEDAPKVGIGALNAYARDAAAADATLLRFVNDCTQCHKCVPVCPADIRRSRIVLWNKLRQVPHEDQRLTLQVGEAQATSSLTVGHVAKELQRHELFGALGAVDVKRLVAGARLRRLEAGEALFAEGDFLDALWLVWEGQLASEVEVAPTPGVSTSGGRGGSRRSVVLQGPGQTVGEAALLADLPADADVTARTDAVVLGFTKYALTAVRERPGNGGFDAALDGLYLARSRAALLARLGLPDEAARAFAAELRPHRHAAGQTILSRVEAHDAVGWVSRGYVREVRRGLVTKRVANYLRPGDVFGGPDPETPDDVLIAYEAATQTDSFLLTRRQLGALDQRFPGLAARLLPERGLEAGAAERRAGADGTFVCPGGLGPLQAHRLLVIDTRLCVDCNNCVDACERRHGRPRLERANAGLQQGPFQVPASCFHCVDPLCLFCSVNGIVREPSGEIRIVEDRCIGCGQCAERCPYDNIFLVPRNLERPGVLERWVAQPLKRLFGVKDGRWALEPEDQVAVKCDLCAGFPDGPACVRSCPTGAARRDEPAVLFGVGRDEPHA